MSEIPELVESAEEEPQVEESVEVESMPDVDDLADAVKDALPESDTEGLPQPEAPKVDLEYGHGGRVAAPARHRQSPGKQHCQLPGSPAFPGASRNHLCAWHFSGHV